MDGSARGGRVRVCREDLLDVDRIEVIAPIAEVTAHFDASPLRQYRPNFVSTHAAQHPDDPIT